MRNLILIISTAIVIRTMFVYQDWIGLLAFLAFTQLIGKEFITVGRELQSVYEWLDG